MSDARDIENFFRELVVKIQDCQDAYAASNGYKFALTEKKAFLSLIQKEYRDEYPELDEIEECYINYKKPSRGNSKINSMRLDYYTDNGTDTLTFILIDVNLRSIDRYPQSSMDEKIRRVESVYANIVNGFYDEALHGAEVKLANLVKARKEDLLKITVLYCTTGWLSNRIDRQQVYSSSFDLLEQDNISFNVSVIDLQELYDRTSGRNNQVMTLVPDEKYTIRCLTGVSSKKYKSYMCVISAKYLADLYFKYGGALLETNVRAYLSTQGKVNKGILLTAVNDPVSFFPYNNGISTTADDAEIEFSKDGMTGVIKSLTNFQIINGGQTTATLAYSVYKYKPKKGEPQVDLSQCFVPMKLTMASSEAFADEAEKAEFLHNIAKYANSQNKVSDTDLNSGHKFYIAIEALSRKIRTPLTSVSNAATYWYFERAKKQFNAETFRMTKAQKKEYEESHPNKFQITDLARVLNTFSARPYDVCWGAEVNATRFHKAMLDVWSKDSEICTEEFYKRSIAKLIVFERVQSVIEHSPWYAERKGNLRQLVTSTVSKLVFDLYQMGAEISLDKVWRKQTCSDELLVLVEKYAKTTFDLLYKLEPTDAREFCKGYSKARGHKKVKSGFWDHLLPVEIEWDIAAYENSGDIKEFTEDPFMNPHDFFDANEMYTKRIEKTLKDFDLTENKNARKFLEWCIYTLANTTKTSPLGTARLYVKALQHVTKDVDESKFSSGHCDGAYKFIFGKVPEKRPFDITDAEEFKKIYGGLISEVFKSDLADILPEDVKERREETIKATNRWCSSPFGKYYAFLRDPAN